MNANVRKIAVWWEYFDFIITVEYMGYLIHFSSAYELHDPVRSNIRLIPEFYLDGIMEEGMYFDDIIKMWNGGTLGFEAMHGYRTIIWSEDCLGQSDENDRGAPVDTGIAIKVEPINNNHVGETKSDLKIEEITFDTENGEFLIELSYLGKSIRFMEPHSFAPECLKIHSLDYTEGIDSDFGLDLESLLNDGAFNGGEPYIHQTLRRIDGKDLHTLVALSVTDKK